eukprot:gene1687-2225_t
MHRAPGDRQVDGGEILVQLTCSVDRPAETVQSLRYKVQRLEGIALVQAIELFRGKGITKSSHKENSKPVKSSTFRREFTYKEAGALVERSDFGGLFDLSQCDRCKDCNDVVLVSGTDGVGTKLLLAQQLGDHSGIGVDLVAMCVNDVLVCGA